MVLDSLRVAVDVFEVVVGIVEVVVGGKSKVDIPHDWVIGSGNAMKHNTLQLQL